MSRNGKVLALLNRQGSAAVIHLNTSRAVVLIHHPELTVAALHPDGRWLATYDTSDEGIEIWNARTGAHERSILPTTRVVRAEFSPDGQWLAACGEAELILCRTGSWSEHCRVNWNDAGHISSYPGAMSFTERGDLLAVGRAGHEIDLIHPADGRLLATLPADFPQPGVYFAPDGLRLAMTGPDLTIQLWDLLRVRQQLQELGLDWEQP